MEYPALYAAYAEYAERMYDRIGRFGVRGRVHRPHGRGHGSSVRMGGCRMTQTTHAPTGVCYFFILGLLDILGKWVFPRYRVVFCVFAVNLLIMFIVSIPNQTNGDDTTVSFDVLDDALALVADEIDNVYNHHNITIVDGDTIIGSYAGNIQRGVDRVYTHENDFGPAF